MERTPDPDTSGDKCAKPSHRYLTLIEFQGLNIKDNHLFHIQCAIFSMITKSLRGASFCLINCLATNRHISRKQI